jgi:asparagine synthetase B (glutamine-hydrolysing)
MCGIFFCLCDSSEEELQLADYLGRCKALVMRRGPDAQAEFRDETTDHVATYFSSVLWLQVVNSDYVFRKKAFVC